MSSFDPDEFLLLFEEDEVPFPEPSEEKRRRSLEALQKLRGRKAARNGGGTQEPEPLSVSEVLSRLKGALEDFPLAFWITGEVAECRRYASGHLYFKLKDADGVLPCIFFLREQRGQKPDFKDGDEIDVRGQATLYSQHGKLQLRISAWRRRGAGALYEAFLRLKAKLEAEGLFDERRKKTLPRFVRRVVVVTSSRAAALQDVLRTLKRRTPWVEAVLEETAVQGGEAPREICRALERADRRGADAILLVRGGGGLEDLQAYNDESVARALARLRTPVITGVGHETDSTIADFVADLRASTPTAAAESVGPDRASWSATLENLDRRLRKAMENRLEDLEQRLDGAERHMPFEACEARWNSVCRRFLGAAGDFRRVFERRFADWDGRLRRAGATLSDPGLVLSGAHTRLGRSARLLNDSAAAFLERRASETGSVRKALSERVEWTFGTLHERIVRASKRFPDVTLGMDAKEARCERRAAVLEAGIRRELSDLEGRLGTTAARLPGAERFLEPASEALRAREERLEEASQKLLGERADAFNWAFYALRQQVDGRLAENREALDRVRRFMPPAQRLLDAPEGRVRSAESLLSALSPDRPFALGFVRVENVRGPVRRLSDLREREALTLRFPEGRAEARVTKIHPPEGPQQLEKLS